MNSSVQIDDADSPEQNLTGQRPLAMAEATQVPSVLAVTSELPWPLNSGGHLRTFHLLRALAGRFRVRLVAATLAGQGDCVKVLNSHGIVVCPAHVGPRTGWKEALRAVAAAVHREPYVLYRRHDRHAVRTEIHHQIAIDPPTLLYFDHLDSLVYHDLRGESPVVIDLHNIYSMLIRRVSTEPNPWWRSLYLRRESELLHKVELRAVSLADRLFTVSTEEQSYFQELGARSACVVPNGVDCATFQNLPVGRGSDPPLILYLGDMSWSPNINAAVFLAREVLPRLRSQIADVRLRIVGRDPVPEVRALGHLSGVEVTGAVPAIEPHLADANVLAVPLNSGGGTRLKILEAFAAGLPVVSTPIGCEGLNVRHEEHLLIADRACFADGIQRMLGDGELAKQIAARARSLVQRQYDWHIIGEMACELVSELVTAAYRS